MNELKFLPQGFILPDGTRRGRILAQGSDWQIVKTSEGNYALVVLPDLYEKWHDFSVINLFVPADLL